MQATARTIGQVSARRYAELVAAARDLVGAMSRSQFQIGEYTLEIEPMRPAGGAHPGPDEKLFTVEGVAVAVRWRHWPVGHDGEEAPVGGLAVAGGASA